MAENKKMAMFDMDGIESWEDAYDRFDSLMDSVRETMHPVVVFSALYAFYSFLCSMREAPEEGDIQKLMARSMDIFEDKSVECFGRRVKLNEMEIHKASEVIEKIMESIGDSAPSSKLH